MQGGDLLDQQICVAPCSLRGLVAGLYNFEDTLMIVLF